MSDSRQPDWAENPFSTRHVRPGAIAYRFPPGKSVLGLVERLRQNGWRGQIVGPHGSGKSALVAALIQGIAQAGRQALLIELHDGQRRLPVDRRRMSALAAGTVVIVDGYEQLAFWSRFALRRFCRRRGLGLVVTSHTSVGLPDLFRTTTSLALAREIVEQLLGEDLSPVTPDEVNKSPVTPDEVNKSPVTPDEVNERFVLRQGDLREVLFDLYDLYERRRWDGNASTDPTQG